MGKVGVLGLFAVLAGVAGIETSDPPAEALQIAMAEEVAALPSDRFETWCRTKGVPADVRFQSGANAASCAWLDRATARVWHASLGAEQADVGLVDGSADAVQRLLHTEYGLTAGVSLDGFPVWSVAIGEVETLLALAEYEDITLLQIKRPAQGIAVSMR